MELLNQKLGEYSLLLPIFSSYFPPPPPTLSSSPYIENLRFGFVTIRHLGLSILFFPYSGYIPIAPY